MITGIHHTGLSVRDLDAAIAFYTRERSFTLLYRFEIADSDANRTMLQLPNAGARGAFLQGALGCLEIFQFSAEWDGDFGEREVYTAGIRHICLQTGISDALFDAMCASGASAHARPAGLGTGNSYAYIRDPEGNLLELEGTPWAPPAATRSWFAHTALVTPDIERLSGFYAMLTGIDVHQRGSFGPDRKFDIVAGIADVQFDGAWLRLANAELEFWQYRQPATISVARRNAAEIGWNHLCFESDDIDADYARLAAAGVEMHGAPMKFGVARVAFGRDPDGNIFELLQPGPSAGVTVGAMLAKPDGQLIDTARTAYRSVAAGAAA
ncbi:VOC family protein [Sphingopyxis sp. YF1]|nr:VOC family protein [Sphingopyxis sp. YF1]